MSRSRPSRPDPDDDGQLGLFAPAAEPPPPPPPPPPSSPRRPVASDLAWNPAAELRRLVEELVRATALSQSLVNAELNKRLGVRSRTGADLEMVRAAVDTARGWLAEAESARAGSLDHLKGSRRALSGVRVTEEQEAARAEFTAEQHLALQAGAGTGKTTTLILLAAAAARRRGQYLAFNRPIAAAAAAKFPPNVVCRTAHSLAHAAVGRRYEKRLQAPRKPAWQAGAALGIAPTMELQIGDRTVTNRGLAYAMVRTVRTFCQSADTHLTLRHVPWLRGLGGKAEHDLLAKMVLPHARRAWEEIQDPAGEVMPFEHDHYFKMWALGEPRVAGDFLLLDEAQDTNPALEKVFNAQRDHAQLIMVGDSAQAIYGWRGARDVMTDFEGRQLHLTQSFRFGPDLAAEANRWLTLTGSPLRLRGDPGQHTTLGPGGTPDAVLCRTNVGAMVTILDLLAQNKHVALAGGGTALEKLAEAAGELKAGRRAGHPELTLFSTWRELQEYAESDPSGGDLLPLIELIDNYSADVILRAVRRLADEQHAQVVVSTAHKAKGKEWPTVRIAPDFEPTPGEETDEHGDPLPRPLEPAEARLAYVAVTRARRHLDPGGLAWLDHHPDAPPRHRNSPAAPSAPASPWNLLGPSPR
ncbi:UvrD-helicase domain-containing protein [Streptomyces sp. V4-01]|uniref:DNA 3'-5' helicase n=1 Tax=Actinacidiphila polyblastidii TaxID=3110430 RepID=A0ABU7PLK7_9ACTN|nr:UvrD-helicase domain-containing protein [Streptomyces sp. V4-01]